MSEPIAPSSPITKTDFILIALLIALVFPLRLWLVHNTEVTARDSIGYVRYALQFERKEWRQVLKDNHQHPGYPVCVWLMSLPVRAMDGETTPANMAFSTQLVNFFASLLVMVPMYLLGRQFFNRPISFGAALLYQYLPISAQHLSDGISEPVYLVFLVSGLLQMTHAIRERSAWRAAACGAFSGLAYLTRPEGLLIMPAFGLTLIALQLLPSHRCSWRQFFACGTAGVVTAMLVGSVYVYATGNLSNKPTVDVISGGIAGAHDRAPLRVAASRHLFAETFAPTDGFAIRLLRSGVALAMEIAQGLFYVGVPIALLGLYWGFASWRGQPAFWAVSAYAAIHGLILIALAMKVGYISDRHVMILVILACYGLVFALRESPRRVLARRHAGGKSAGVWGAAAVWFAALYVALLGACLPKATQRLHDNRVANRQAGLWLREHVEAGDVVVDDHAWSHFFAGLILEEGREPRPTERSKCYIVTTRSRDPQIDAERRPVILTPAAQVVYTWPEHGDAAKARVTVYAQPRDPRIHPWRGRRIDN